MRIRLGSFLLIASLALTACRGGGTASLPATGSNLQSYRTDAATLPFAATNVQVQHACSAPAPEHRACFALRRMDIAPQSLSGVHAMALNSIGYGPSQLAAAYKLPTIATTPTVAIVDAYDDPNAEADLGQYRSAFGLPACTSLNGCFTKVGQTGGAVPIANTGWAEEESLDLDMVSAICPTCHILLVEATSNSNANLATAVNFAATVPGVAAISNSYGGSEGTSGTNSNYNHPGIVITASTGDNGYGPSQPAGYSSVVAVGGTRLVPAPNVRGWDETAWSCNSASACSSSGTGGAGSGCSAVTAKPAWQAAVSTVSGCTMRNIGDVSAVADPATGVFVYDSYGIAAGFYIFGGTSVASPIIASMYALAGNAATVASGGSGNAAKYLWQHHTGNVNDVLSGTNEPSASGSCLAAWNYICKARVGYDGLTGWGTPSGLGAL